MENFNIKFIGGDWGISDGGSKFVTSGGGESNIEGWGGIDAGSRTLLGGDWG